MLADHLHWNPSMWADNIHHYRYTFSGLYQYIIYVSWKKWRTWFSSTVKVMIHANWNCDWEGYKPPVYMYCSTTTCRCAVCKLQGSRAMDLLQRTRSRSGKTACGVIYYLTNNTPSNLVWDEYVVTVRSCLSLNIHVLRNELVYHHSSPSPVSENLQD